MRVLLDESTPRRLAASFPDSFDTRTVQQMGWAGRGNGELLRLARLEGGFVDLGQAEPEKLHQLLAVRVIALAEFREIGGWGLPEPRGEGEGIEAVGGRVAEPCFQRAAVFAGPPSFPFSTDSNSHWS